MCLSCFSLLLVSPHNLFFALDYSLFALPFPPVPTSWPVPFPGLGGTGVLQRSAWQRCAQGVLMAAGTLPGPRPPQLQGLCPGTCPDLLLSASWGCTEPAPEFEAPSVCRPRGSSHSSHTWRIPSQSKRPVEPHLWAPSPRGQKSLMGDLFSPRSQPLGRAGPHPHPNLEESPGRVQGVAGSSSQGPALS